MTDKSSRTITTNLKGAGMSIRTTWAPEQGRPSSGHMNLGKRWKYRSRGWSLHVAAFELQRVPHIGSAAGSMCTNRAVSEPRSQATTAKTL